MEHRAEGNTAGRGQQAEERGQKAGAAEVGGRKSEIRGQTTVGAAFSRDLAL